MSKKTFKVSLNGKQAIDLEIEGDDDLVADFIDKALTDSYGAFYKTREAFTELFINGIRHEIQIIKRTPEGRFAKKGSKNNGERN